MTRIILNRRRLEISIDKNGERIPLDKCFILRETRDKIFLFPGGFPEIMRLVMENKLNVNADYLDPQYFMLSYRPRSLIKLRDYQERIFNELRRNNYRGIVSLPTGAGKTIIGLSLIEHLGVRSLIIVPTIDLMK